MGRSRKKGRKGRRQETKTAGGNYLQVVAALARSEKTRRGLEAQLAEIRSELPRFIDNATASVRRLERALRIDRVELRAAQVDGAEEDAPDLLRQMMEQHGIKSISRHVITEVSWVLVLMGVPQEPERLTAYHMVIQDWAKSAGVQILPLLFGPADGGNFAGLYSVEHHAGESEADSVTLQLSEALDALAEIVSLDTTTEVPMSTARVLERHGLAKFHAEDEGAALDGAAGADEPAKAPPLEDELAMRKAIEPEKVAAPALALVSDADHDNRVDGEPQGMSADDVRAIRERLDAVGSEVTGEVIGEVIGDGEVVGHIVDNGIDEILDRADANADPVPDLEAAGVLGRAAEMIESGNLPPEKPGA